MPFTLVHPAAVLPLTRFRLPPAALALGAMAPDLPYYVSLQWIGGDYNLTLTHEWSSLLWLDPMIGLVLLALFRWVLRRPLTALLPVGVAARIPIRPGPMVWWAVALALVLGAGTHLAWDALCDVLGYARSTYLNLLSDGVGAAVLLWWLRRSWLTSTPHPVPPGTLLARRARAVVLTVVVTVTLAYGTFRALRLIPLVSNDLRGQGLYNRPEVLNDAVREFAVQAGVALAAALLLYALAWHLVGRRVSSR